MYGVKESLFGKGSLQSEKKIKRALNSVCKISVNRSTASGFYTAIEVKGVEKKYIVTNNHVLGKRNDLRDATALFAVDGKKYEMQINDRAPFLTNESLDVSLVECDVDDIQKIEEFDVLPLHSELTSVMLKKKDIVTIIQHPDGREKEFSTANITDVNAPVCFYDAETEPGSSGSPIFNSKYDLVGVHHTGSKSYNYGTLWAEVVSFVNGERVNKWDGKLPDNKKVELNKEAKMKLSKAMGNQRWREFAEMIDISVEDIDTIDYDIPDARTKVVKCLDKLIRREGEKAWCVIEEALISMEEHTLLNTLKGLLGIV